MEGRNDGVPGASEAPPDAPEALTPEEAEARRRAKSQRSDAAGTRRSSIGVQAEAPRPLTDAADAAARDDAIVPVAPDADDVVVPAWSKYDLGFALQQLRSLREGVVRRTLRKLHIRWFHCSAKRMCTCCQPQVSTMMF